MPYAAKAKIEHEFDTNHLNIWLTFRHPMDQDLKPPLALWLLEEDDNPVDIIDSDWQDQFTILLTSDAIVDTPDRVTVEYNGPNSNLQTTWGKDWEPWGPILSTDIGKAPCFVDRGDPGSWDYLIGDFTADSAWHDLDLSAIVPEHAKSVLLLGVARATIVGKVAYIRKKGNVNNYNVARWTTQVASVSFITDTICPIDADRKVEYILPAGQWEQFGLIIKGWWL